MLRYLRLYWYLVKFSVSKTAEFRLDFFFRIVMDALYYAVQIIFYKVIFLSTGSVGGWNEPQVMLFVSSYLIVDAVQMTLFSNNLWWLPQLINKGDLDYYIVRPVSSLFFVSLREFAFNSFLNLVMALGISIYFLNSYSISVTTTQITLYYLFSLLGGVLHYFIHLTFLIPIFWLHTGRGLEQVYWPFTRFMERPDPIFTKALRLLITTLVPYAIMASFPTRILIEGQKSEIILHIIIVFILFGLFVRWFWYKALGQYSSASS